VSGRIFVSVCQSCLTPNIEVFYTWARGWVCEQCRDQWREARRKEPVNEHQDRDR